MVSAAVGVSGTIKMTSGGAEVAVTVGSIEVTCCEDREEMPFTTKIASKTKIKIRATAISHRFLDPLAAPQLCPAATGLLFEILIR